MKKTIYISGPITDNETGKPRDGWQKDFVRAEKMLRTMGYDVVNPVDIAKETEEEWKQVWQAPVGIGHWRGPYSNALRVKGPTRATYILACLQVMNTEALAGRLHGLLVIGRPDDACCKSRIYHSHGVQMELQMALMLGIPMFAEFYDCCEVDIHLLPVMDGLRICEKGQFGKENWSDKI